MSSDRNKGNDNRNVATGDQENGFTILFFSLQNIVSFSLSFFHSSSLTSAPLSVFESGASVLVY